MMDNAKIHHSKKTKLYMEAAEEEGRVIVFQSKYSPELNPIELVFGIIKRRIKKREQVPANLFLAVGEQCQNLSTDDCRNTIKKILDKILNSCVCWAVFQNNFCNFYQK